MTYIEIMKYAESDTLPRLEKLKDAVSEYLDTRFGRWHCDIIHDT